MDSASDENTSQSRSRERWTELHYSYYSDHPARNTNGGHRMSMDPQFPKVFLPDSPLVVLPTLPASLWGLSFCHMALRERQLNREDTLASVPVMP